jgi:hypothetical protein
VHRLGLELDELALLELYTGDANGITLVEPECPHHPEGEVHAALLRDELKHTRVRRSSGVVGVPQLEHPWGRKVELRELC